MGAEIETNMPAAGTVDKTWRPRRTKPPNVSTKGLELQTGDIGMQHCPWWGWELHCPPQQQDVYRAVALDQLSSIHLVFLAEYVQIWSRAGGHRVRGGKPNTNKYAERCTSCTRNWTWHAAAAPTENGFEPNEGWRVPLVNKVCILSYSVRVYSICTSGILRLSALVVFPRFFQFCNLITEPFVMVTYRIYSTSVIYRHNPFARYSEEEFSFCFFLANENSVFALLDKTRPKTMRKLRLFFFFFFKVLLAVEFDPRVDKRERLLFLFSPSYKHDYAACALPCASIHESEF